MRRARLALSLAAALATSVTAIPTPYNYEQAPLAAVESPGFVFGHPGQRVNVSLYVMSRCPDARMCESVFEDVLKHEGILDQVDLKLEFLGDIDRHAAYGVDCMHGDVECAGDAHQLCLAAHTPLEQFYAALSCMNYGNFPGSIGTIALTRRCAETSGIDWWASGVGKCVEGKRAAMVGRYTQRLAALTGEGYEPRPKDWDTEDEDAPLEHLGKEARLRLADSVRHTKNVGVTKSCTIEIASTLKHDKTRRCVVDGGVWKGCDDGHTAADFVRVISKEWKALNPT